MKDMCKNIIITCLIFTIISFIWQGLELYFYNEIQSRIVDDIIGFIMICFISDSVGCHIKNKTDLKIPKL